MGIFRIDVDSLQSSISNVLEEPLKDSNGQNIEITSYDKNYPPKIGDTRTSFSVKSCFSDSKTHFAIIGKKQGDLI